MEKPQYRIDQERDIESVKRVATKVEEILAKTALDQVVNVEREK